MKDKKVKPDEWDDTEIGDFHMNTYIAIIEEKDHKVTNYNNVIVQILFLKDHTDDIIKLSKIKSDSTYKEICEMAL